MRVGLNLADSGAQLRSLLPVIAAAEGHGLDCVWLGEAYGSEAVSALGFIAANTSSIGLGSAILQVGARTPANLAMTALTLDHLSEGRFRLGLGVSGPQVMEGWHGVAFANPLRRLTETIEVVQEAIRRTGPLTYRGRTLTIPYDGDDATGLGRPLKSSLRPVRAHIPTYVAALGPQTVAMAAERADGWLPIFYSPFHEEVCSAGLDAGLARRTLATPLDIVASPMVAVGASIADCRDQLRPGYALYIGGMGAKGRNFYFDLMVRYGFESAAQDIQTAYLNGDKDKAIALVPDEIVDSTALVGPPERIAEQLQVWTASRVTSVALRISDTDTLTAVLNACRKADPEMIVRRGSDD